MEEKLQRATSKLALLEMQLTGVGDVEVTLGRQLTLATASHHRMLSETVSKTERARALVSEIALMKEEVRTFPWPDVMAFLEQDLTSLYDRLTTTQRFILGLRDAIADEESRISALKKSSMATCDRYRAVLQGLAGVTGPLAWTHNHPASMLHSVDNIAVASEDALVDNVTYIGRASVDHHMITKRLQEANLSLAYKVKELVLRKEEEVIEIVDAFEREKDRLRKIYGGALSINVEQSFHMNRGTNVIVPCGGTDRQKLLRQKMSEDSTGVHVMEKDFDEMRAERVSIQRMVTEAEATYQSRLEKLRASRQAKSDAVKGEKKLAATLRSQRDEMRGILMDMQGVMKETRKKE